MVLVVDVDVVVEDVVVELVVDDVVVELEALPDHAGGATDSRKLLDAVFQWVAR